MQYPNPPLTVISYSLVLCLCMRPPVVELASCALILSPRGRNIRLVRCQHECSQQSDVYWCIQMPTVTEPKKIFKNNPKQNKKKNHTNYP